MKNKIVKYGTLLLTLTGFMSCQSKGQFTTAANNKSLLWEITGNGLDKAVYIYGTMHLLCKQDAALSPNLTNVIKEADEIYFEIDMDDLGQLLSGFSMGSMKHDTTLTQLYSDTEYERVKDFFTKHGMGMQLNLFNKII